MLASRQGMNTGRNLAAMWLLVIGALVASVMATATPADAQVPPATTVPEPGAPEPGGPEVPDEPTLFPTVEPSTGLVDGQRVQVTLTGLPAAANIISVQCAATAFSQDQCDLSYIELRQANSDGVYSVEFAVARQILIQGQLLDCAPDACIIGVGLMADDLFTPLETGGAALNFDSSVPLPAPPTVKVRKNGRLKDQQKVSVRGAGWSPDIVRVSAEQCFSVVGERGEGVSEGCRYSGEGIVTLEGKLNFKTTAHRIHYIGVRRFDCVDAAVTCRLVVRSFDRRTQESSVELRFSADGAVAPRPKVNLSPRKNLVDGQRITVRLQNATIGNEWSLQQCTVGGPEEYPSCRYLNPVMTPDGAEVSVSRALLSNGELVDCAAARNLCFVRAMNYRTQAAAKKGLIFAPTPEPLPEPSVVFSDNLTSLTDRTLVTAEISGPLFEVNVSQCPSDFNNVTECAGLGHASPDEEAEAEERDDPAEEEAEEAIATTTVVTNAGTLLIEGQVRRVLWLEDEPVDCASAPGSCVLVAWDWSYGPIGEPAPLTFVDQGPPVVPSVEMKNTDLAQRETVTASLTGLSPGGYMFIQQCVSDEDYDCRFLRDFEIRDSELTVDVVVNRSLAINGTTFDCGLEPESCEIRFGFEGGPGAILRVGLTFDPDAPAPPRPNVSISPRTKLTHRQDVEITVDEVFGFLSIVQCPREATGFDETSCAYLGWQGYEFDEDTGTSRFDVQVLRVLPAAEGRLDCAETNRRCKVLVFAQETQETIGEKWIQFDASVDAPPTPSISATPTTDLVDGQDVEISAATDARTIVVLQCAGDVDSPNHQRCRDVARLDAEDAPSTFVAAVSRMIVGNDCARVSCSLVLIDNHTGRTAASQPLSFDPDGVKLRAPTLSVTPRFRLADRQQVEIALTGLVAWHQFRQCVVVDGQTTNCIGLASDHDPIRRAVTTSTATVRRMINGHDCAAQARSCAVVAEFGTGVENYEEAPRQKRKLLTFDPNAAAFPGPSITVDPSTGLADGDIVRVAGSGFKPQFELYVGLCTADFLASIEGLFGNCANEPSGLAEVGEDGTFEIDIPVLVDPEGFTGETLNCLANGCVVMATDGFEFIVAEISFDPDAPVGQQLVINGLSWPRSLVDGSETPTNGFSQTPRFDLHAS